MKALIVCDEREACEFKLDGATLLERVHAQCVEHGATPVVIRGGLHWVDTMLCSAAMDQSMACFWEGDMVAIQGNAVYTNRALGEIFSPREGIRFVGRMRHSPLTGGFPEIFAVQWSPSAQERILVALRALQEFLAKDLSGSDSDFAPNGSPWQLYRHLQGFDIKSHEFNYNDDMLYNLSDFTDVFHEPQRFELWKVRNQYRYVMIDPTGMKSCQEVPVAKEAQAEAAA